MDEPKPKDLASLQADLAAAVDELRAAVNPAALAARARAATTDKAKQAALDSSGKPKPQVLIAASLVFALLVAGLVVRLTRDKGRGQ